MKYNKGQDNALLKVAVKKGKFDIAVITTGELQALSSEDIRGPSNLRIAGLSQLKLSDLIPEGTVVKQGGYIATLDRSPVNQKVRELQTDKDKTESQYVQARLDTAIEMRKLRDDLLNLKFDMEEKKLVLEQSKYEPPATIRQAEIELDKTKRSYAQSKTNYDLKLRQNKAKVQDAANLLASQSTKLDQMIELMQQFVITAPKDGMLIYKKDWSGRKIKAGSDIWGFDPVVATLPDLSVMISQTYVNEIDISKVKIGQPVNISVDAFPGKKYSGKVLTIANVGEQLPNSDTKVFEVTISIGQHDTLLRPAMTTANHIITSTMPESTLYLPLDCIQGNDSMTFVYKEVGMGIVKQEVIVGASSQEFAELKAGLIEGEQVYMSVPPAADKMKLNTLSKDIKEKYKPKPMPPAENKSADKQPAALPTGIDISKLVKTVPKK